MASISWSGEQDFDTVVGGGEAYKYPKKRGPENTLRDLDQVLSVLSYIERTLDSTYRLLNHYREEAAKDRAANIFWRLADLQAKITPLEEEIRSSYVKVPQECFDLLKKGGATPGTVYVVQFSDREYEIDVGYGGPISVTIDHWRT